MIAIRIVFAACLVAACSTSSRDADEQRHHCEQMRDHVIDLRLADVGPDHTSDKRSGQGASSEPPQTPIDLAQHRAAMKQALGDRFINDCVSQMTADQVSCALSAKSQDAVNACSAKTASN